MKILLQYEDKEWTEEFPESPILGDYIQLPDDEETEGEVIARTWVKTDNGRQLIIAIE